MDEKRFQELFPEPGKETGVESLSFFRHMKQKMQPEQLFKADGKYPVNGKSRKWNGFILYSATAAACLILFLVLPNLPGLLESSVGTNDVFLDESVPGNEDRMREDSSGQEDERKENGKEENGKEKKNENQDGKNGNEKSGNMTKGNGKEKREQSRQEEEIQEKENQEKENQEKGGSENGGSGKTKDNTKKDTKEKTPAVAEKGEKEEKEKDGAGKENQNKEENTTESAADKDGILSEEESADSAVSEKNEELQKALTDWYAEEFPQQNTDTADDSALRPAEDVSLDDSSISEDAATFPNTNIDAEDSPDSDESMENVPEASDAAIETDSDMKVSTEEIFGQLKRDLEAFPYLCFYDKGQELWYQMESAQENGEGKRLAGDAFLYRKPSSVLDEDNSIQYRAYVYKEETDPSAVYVRLSVQGESRYYRYIKIG